MPVEGEDAMRAMGRGLWNDESGQDLIEYVLAALLIAVAAAVVLGVLGDNIANAFSQASNDLKNP